jgi:hypothetical protein
MNYEDFSPQCKLGIDQFKLWISKQKIPDIWDDHAGLGNIFYDKTTPFVENNSTNVNYVLIKDLFVSTLVLNGVSLKEANEALKFADEKCFWRKDVFYLGYQGLGKY